MSGVSVFKPCDEEPCALNNPKRERQEFAAQQGAGGMFGIRIGQGALNECSADTFNPNPYTRPQTRPNSNPNPNPHLQSSPSPNPNQVRGMAHRLIRAIAWLLARAAHGPGEDGAP